MKNVLLALLMIITVSAMAQQRGARAGSRMQQFTPEQKEQLHVKKLTLDLNLDASQQKEVARLLSERRARMETLRAEMKGSKSRQDLSSDEKFKMKNRFLDEKIAFKSKMKKVLSPEQFEKWESQLKNRREGNQLAHRRAKGERLKDKRK